MKEKKYSPALVLILLSSSLIGLIVWIWQTISLPGFSAGHLNIFFALFDFYLAYIILKNKPYSKKILWARIILGALGWLFLFYAAGIKYGLLWPKIGFLASLIILISSKGKREIFSALLTALFILINFYFSVIYITYKQPILIELKKYGKNTYLSKNYPYQLKTPANWKIIQRKDFAKIKEKYLESKAEIALISTDAESFCLVIPDKLRKPIKNYSLARIKKALLDNLKKKRTIKIKETSSFISKESGFTIKYQDIIDGRPQEYLILYIRGNEFDLRFIGWSLRFNKEMVYRQLKSIAKNIFAKNKNEGASAPLAQDITDTLFE
ncbi:MAG: hypothetical protein K9L61_00660 [Candidatus Omnitrophica bacterium]|nr:hypothetical protein [Candidatus Omnitrophota bacterium]